MMKRLSKILVIFVPIFFMASCSNKEDNKLLGQIVGSVAGAYLGSKVGSGIGKNLTTVLGGTVGFLIGGKLAEILDSDEQEELNNVINSSLSENNNNVPKQWISKNNNNTNAEILPLNTYKKDESTCRDFRKIVNKNNKKYEETSTACRDENGNWIII